MKHEHNHDGGGSNHRARGHGRGRHSGDSSSSGGQRHHRHGGQGRMGRFFEHGDLRLVALQLIAEKPRHGYEIIKAIEEQSGGAYTPSAGAVYPTLTLLQELGQLTVKDGEDGRKLHTITEEGTAALFANRKTVEAVFARIAQTGSSSGSAPQLEESMHRLKYALRLRLSRGPIDDAQIQGIVSAIDHLVAEVEQN